MDFQKKQDKKELCTEALELIDTLRKKVEFLFREESGEFELGEFFFDVEFRELGPTGKPDTPHGNEWESLTETFNEPCFQTFQDAKERLDEERAKDDEDGYNWKFEYRIVAKRVVEKRVRRGKKTRKIPGGKKKYRIDFMTEKHPYCAENGKWTPCDESEVFGSLERARERARELQEEDRTPEEDPYWNHGPRCEFRYRIVEAEAGSDDWKFKELVPEK